MSYKSFIEEYFMITDKEGNLVPFILNDIQNRYLEHDMSNADVICKARQQGFSSIIDGVFTTDFLTKKNCYSVIVADVEDNAMILLERVKGFIRSFEEKAGIHVKLKYNSKYELMWPFMNNRFTIGTAKSTEFGRSRTIHNLHFSEIAFYNNIQKMIAGAVQAVTPTGRKLFESTANGFNDYKKFYEDAKSGENGYRALFYKASDFYAKEILDQKRKELGRLFRQEYPETDIEAFVTSGDCFFNTDILEIYLNRVKNCHPRTENIVHE